MLLSPAARHREQASTKPGKQTAGEQHRLSVVAAPGKQDNEYRLMCIRLADDARKIASIRSRDRANGYKRDVMPHYWGYCSAVVSRQGRESQHDAVVVQVCVWCFDVGEISKGLLLAEYALSHYLIKPDGYRHTQSPVGFKRNLAETLAEAIADTVLKSEFPGEYRGQLETLMELIRQHDMSDYINAKLHRAYALAISATVPELAIHHYTESVRLRPLVSIKKTIARLNRQIEEQHHD